jgi:urease accessory protein
MLCDRVLYNIGSEPRADLAIDWLDLTWFDCTQRALRKRTRGGVDVGILLPVGQTPRHGDVLHRNEECIIAVDLLPAEVWVASPRGVEQMGRLAIELGNLHVPAEVAGEEMVLIPDGPVEAVLKRVGVSYRRDIRRFVPERSSVSGIPMRAGDFGISRTALQKTS